MKWKAKQIMLENGYIICVLFACAYRYHTYILVC